MYDTSCSTGNSRQSQHTSPHPTTTTTTPTTTHTPPHPPTPTPVHNGVKTSEFKIQYMIFFPLCILNISPNPQQTRTVYPSRWKEFHSVLLCHYSSWHGPLTRYGKLRVAHAPGMFSPPPTSKETASKRSRHPSRHMRLARAVMHVGVTNPRWRGKTFPAFPALAQPAILRIW